MQDFPSSWWKKQSSDTPLRTIKTIMHTIVKLNGPVIGEVVKNVRGVTPESELWTYVQKLLKVGLHLFMFKLAARKNNSNYKIFIVLWFMFEVFKLSLSRNILRLQCRFKITFLAHRLKQSFKIKYKFLTVNYCLNNTHNNQCAAKPTMFSVVC